MAQDDPPGHVRLVALIEIQNCHGRHPVIGDELDHLELPSLKGPFQAILVRVHRRPPSRLATWPISSRSLSTRLSWRRGTSLAIG
jgi:hypothetical protein